MRHLIFCAYLSLFGLVLSKNPNTKSLTESMGQEVIEIAGPKELPQGLEEEPSADSDEEVGSTTATSKKELKKTTAVQKPEARRQRPLKDVEKIDGVTIEDEETRLEKELAELYKDPEYKDSSEVTDAIVETKTVITTSSPDDDKPIGRARPGFKFYPDSTSKRDIERFRTSLDTINCPNKERLSNPIAPSQNAITLHSSSTKLCYAIHYVVMNLLLLNVICH